MGNAYYTDGRNPYKHLVNPTKDRRDTRFNKVLDLSAAVPPTCSDYRIELLSVKRICTSFAPSLVCVVTMS